MSVTTHEIKLLPHLAANFVGGRMDIFRGNTSWLALIGAGFFWAWVDCVVALPVLFAPFGTTDQMNFAYALCYLASIFPPVLTLIFPLVVDRLTAKPSFPLVLGALGFTGCLFIALGGTVNGIPLFCVGLVLAGFMMGSLLIVWGRVCVAQGTTKTIIHITGAYAVSLIIDLFVIFLQPIPSAIFLASLPLISGWLFYILAHHSQDGKALELGSANTFDELGVETSPQVKVRFDAQIITVIILFYVVLGFTGFINDNASLSMPGTILYAIAWEIAGFFLFLFCVFHSWRTRKVTIFALVMIVLAFMSLLLPVSSRLIHNLSGAFMVAGSAAFDILVWALVSLTHNFTKRPYVGTVAIVALCQQLGSLVGFAFAFAVPNVASDMTLYLVSSALICLALIVGILYIRRSNKLVLSALFTDANVNDLPEDTPHSSPFLIVPIAEPTTLERPRENTGEQTSAQGASENHVQTYHNAVNASEIDLIAEQYHFTRREREVFSHLACGRSAPYIAEVYQVSENTIRSHIKHIYTKLDVHTRQELLSLVNTQEKL